MNAMDRHTRARLQQIEKVYQRRVDAAAKRVQVQREIYNKALREKSEQELLIAEYADQLQALTDYRQASTLQDSASATLQVHAHRDWLNYEVERERFYLQTMISDLADGKAALTTARKDWMQLNDKLERLREQAVDQARELEKDTQARTEAEWEDVSAGRMQAAIMVDGVSRW